MVFPIANDPLAHWALDHPMALTRTWQNCQCPYNEVAYQKYPSFPKRNWWTSVYATCYLPGWRNCIKLNQNFIHFKLWGLIIYSLITQFSTFSYLGARPAGTGERVGPPILTSLTRTKRNLSKSRLTFTFQSINYYQTWYIISYFAFTTNYF